MKLKTFAIATSSLLCASNTAAYLLVKLNGFLLPGAAYLGTVSSGLTVLLCACLVFGFGSMSPEKRERYLLGGVFFSVVMTALHLLITIDLFLPILPP